MQSIEQNTMKIPHAKTLLEKRQNSIVREVVVPSIKSKIVLYKEPSRESRLTDSQNCFIQMEPETDQKLTWFWEQTDRLRDLLAFLFGMPVTSKELSAPTHRSRVYNFVDIFRRTQPVAEVIYGHQLDFTLNNLGEKVPDVINAWFELNEDERVPFNLCLDVINNIHGYKKFEFLALMQALESHHQLYYEKEGLKVKRYRNPKGGPKKEPDMMDRLEELREHFPGDPPPHDDFLKSVKVTRDYYTHYNPKETKASIESHRT